MQYVSGVRENGRYRMKCKNCKNLIDHWCEKVIDSPDEEMDRECKHYEVMSNADRIKNMSVEEMANFILTISDDEKSFSKIINGEEIYGSVCEVMQWLESEAKDNG